jgi:hypothetical protein
MRFYTAVGCRVKVWSALTGTLLKIFQEVAEKEICMFKVDRLGKRLILGDISGRITLHNLINGVKVSTLPAHTDQILSVFQFQT